MRRHTGTIGVRSLAGCYRCMRLSVVFCLGGTSKWSDLGRTCLNSGSDNPYRHVLHLGKLSPPTLTVHS